MDLFLDPEQKRGATRALFVQLRDGILSGRFAAGDRLPASRELAGQLGVSRHTVTTVYGRLVAEGFLEGRAGGGTAVGTGRQRPSGGRFAGGDRPASGGRCRCRLGRVGTDAAPIRPASRHAGPATVPARRVASMRHRRPPGRATGLRRSGRSPRVAARPRPVGRSLPIGAGRTRSGHRHRRDAAGDRPRDATAGRPG